MPFTLAILPETFPVSLDALGMTGVVAHLRPLDADELAGYFDKFPYTSPDQNAGSVWLLKQRIASVEGVDLGDGTPFDAADPQHVRAFLSNRLVVNALYAALMDRAGLGAALEKKSASPSVSPAAPSGAISSAGNAATSGETRITAASRPPSASPRKSGTRSS